MDGEVARAAGAISEPGRPAAAHQAGARTPSEVLVAEVWCELLEVDEVGVTDNFFEVGGHSLLAAQVVYQLADRTGLPLELETFFDLATVQEVAAELDRMRLIGEGAEESAIFEEEL